MNQSAPEWPGSQRLSNTEQQRGERGGERKNVWKRREHVSVSMWEKGECRREDDAECEVWIGDVQQSEEK